jgi:hypothetical protein
LGINVSLTMIMAVSLRFFIYFITFVIMDIQFWLYIIFLVIVFLVRVLKKGKEETENHPAKPQRREPDQRGGRQVAERPKALTFEELLREITEAKESAKPTYRPEPKSVVDYDDDIPEEEQDLETADPGYRKKDSVYEIYETAKTQAFYRPSLEETMNVQNTVIEFGKFKAFETTEGRNILYDYTKDLMDPDGLKKAFVLTEILNRKF